VIAGLAFAAPDGLVGSMSELTMTLLGCAAAAPVLLYIRLTRPTTGTA